MSPAANDVVVRKIDVRGVQYVLHEGAPTWRRQLRITAGQLCACILCGILGHGAHGATACRHTRSSKE